MALRIIPLEISHILPILGGLFLVLRWLFTGRKITLHVGIEMKNEWSKYLRIFFKKTDFVSKLIYTNIAFFVLGHIFNVCAYLFSFSKNIFFDALALPQNFQKFIVKPWTIITYGFLHEDFIHLFFNLLVLHYIGVCLLVILQSSNYSNFTSAARSWEGLFIWSVFRIYLFLGIFQPV